MSINTGNAGYFILHSVVCAERMLDNQKIYDYLILNGWRPTDRISEANLVIIGTCAVYAREENNSLAAVQYLKRKVAESAIVVIVGCLPVINPARLKSVGDFITVSPNAMSSLDEIIGARIPYDQISEPHRILINDARKRNGSLEERFAIMTRGWRKNGAFRALSGALSAGISVVRQFKYENLPLWLQEDPASIYYLKISSGCLGNCTYCAIRMAIGSLKSRSQEEIVGEFKKGLDQRHKSIRLLAEDSGCYGLDIGTDIVRLLKELLTVGGNDDYRLMIANFNPQWLIRYFSELSGIIRDHHRKIAYLHVPVQSGSDKILELMKRPYRISQVKKCLNHLKRMTPSLKVITNIMVGFPGEEKEDFEASMAFLKEVQPNYTFVFPYSQRPHTPAVSLEDKIPQGIIKKRYAELTNALNYLKRRPS